MKIWFSAVKVPKKAFALQVRTTCPTGSFLSNIFTKICVKEMQLNHVMPTTVVLQARSGRAVASMPRYTGAMLGFSLTSWNSL